MTCSTDIAAIEAELKALNPPAAPAEQRKQPRRVPLPAQFPRTVVYHEPDNTNAPADASSSGLANTSAKSSIARRAGSPWQHVRGKWVCRECETLTLTQAPVPAQVIDKGIPTAGLLAHVMVAKFADHLPLYRQEKIFWPRRSGYRPLDTGAMGRLNRRTTPALGERAA
ncbi:IS66 family transposase [Stutzerimonas stutzeri]|uniref:IS66 family transposase n=1 Tax=Stutzerimonas stutzeri TaxID=316 RepID=UPI003C6F1019